MSYSNLITRGFHPARRRAGIRRIRFHDLRHTYASLMIRNGEDIVAVSRLMGHANASFTFNVYCLLPRKRNPIGDRLASLVFGNKMETASDLEIQLESMWCVKGTSFGYLRFLLSIFRQAPYPTVSSTTRNPTDPVQT
jgi:Phage integrase family